MVEENFFWSFKSGSYFSPEPHRLKSLWKENDLWTMHHEIFQYAKILLFCLLLPFGNTLVHSLFRLRWTTCE